MLKTPEIGIFGYSDGGDDSIDGDVGSIFDGNSDFVVALDIVGFPEGVFDASFKGNIVGTYVANDNEKINIRCKNPEKNLFVENLGLKNV